MILKKPYAFLIKHFKIIQIIILLLLGYVNSYYSKISTFFKTYSSNHFYDINIAKDYLPISVFVSLIVVLGLISIMYYLMNNKKKPTKLYIFSLIYYFIVLISMFLIYDKINTLYEVTIEQRTSRLYQDIYFILRLPSYYFMVMYLIRGIGFDIKKFNFKKDLEELEIKAEDNEEFEFVLGKDTYIYKRKIHRFIRELIYIYKENSFIINIILLVIGGILLTLGFINLSISIHKYHVGSSISATNFTYKLNNAFITSYDYKNEVINLNKRYILVDITITNKSNNVLKAENIYLSYNNNKQSILKTSLSNAFSDIGTVYKGDMIPNEPTDLILVYEVPANTRIYNTKLMVYTKSVTKNDKTEYIYKEYKFNLINLDKYDYSEEISLNNSYNLGGKLYGNTNVSITGIKIQDKYEYTYEKCYSEDNCQTLTDVIIPENRNQKKLLIVDYSMSLDENSLVVRSLNGDKTSILNKVSRLSYTRNDKMVELQIYGKSNDRLDNKIFYEVPNDLSVEDVSKYFILKTREARYRLSF